MLSSSETEVKGVQQEVVDLSDDCIENPPVRNQTFIQHIRHRRNCTMAGHPPAILQTTEIVRKVYKVCKVLFYTDKLPPPGLPLTQGEG